MWYAVGVAVRNLLFARGLKQSWQPPVATIGVGNLAVGGTGKTPHTEYLLRLLADHYPTAMLSRGYKRQTQGFVLDDGSHRADLLGDEPAMMARKFAQVQVAVCEKRVEGVKRLLAQAHPPQLILLDDVYQHRYIRPDINILLTEYGNPYFEDRILPFGNLREARREARRADLIVATKCPAGLDKKAKQDFISRLRPCSNQQVFFSHLRYGQLQNLDGTPADTSLQDFGQVLVVTGIANPVPLLEEIGRSCEARHLSFADHHNFSDHDYERIHEAYINLPSSRKAIITTEKDAIRLHGLPQATPVYVLPVEVVFDNENDADFDQVVSDSILKKKR